MIFVPIYVCMLIIISPGFSFSLIPSEIGILDYPQPQPRRKKEGNVVVPVHVNC